MVMKNLLINLYSQNHEWCQHYFPDRTLGMLPLAGRCAVEHYIDLALYCMADSLLLLEPTYNECLAEHLRDFRQGALTLHYRRGKVYKNVRQLIEANTIGCGSDCLIVYGMVLPKAFTSDTLEKSFVLCEDDDGSTDGIYWLKDGLLLRSTAECYQINSLKSYFEFNFTVLKEDYYNLPGYLTKDKVHTGTNIVIRQNTDLRGPLVLCDNTFIERDCRIANAVLGTRALIDKGTVVEHSIIFDRTYVAGNLEIINKIVTPGRIVDPYTGGMLERNCFSYAFSPLQNSSAWILQFWEHTIALILAVGLLFPYLLILPYYLVNKTSHWCWKLSMDRYPGFWAVLFCRRELIKSHPENKRFVFQMGECYSVQNTPDQLRIYDYYYHYHCSCFLMLQVVLKCLGKRGFATYAERKREKQQR